MEWFSFGPMLQRCRVWFLPELSEARNALVLGDGDGRFAAALLKAAPQVRVTAVDVSGAMLAQLRKNCRGYEDRLETHQAVLPGGLAELVVEERFDLVATHFFLDCLTTAEVEALAAMLRARMADGGRWVVSDFAIARGWLRLPSAMLVAALYKAFRMLTGLRTQSLPQHGEALERCGFTLLQRRRILGGILIAEVWEPSPEIADKIVTER
jgi:ubiquinone/menaquinone biosynthesis C-methylase UbiE